MVRYSPMTRRITTPRLALRAWDLADATHYQALVAERGDGAPALEDIRDSITNQLAASDKNGIALSAVTRLMEGDFIGYCGLVVRRTNLDEPEIAFELHRNLHNRGYATEAAGAIMSAAAETGRRRLWATVGAWNAPSLRVCDKLGFERDRISEESVGRVIWLSRGLM